MRVSKVRNLSLLQIIAREGKIAYNELKKEYCVPTPPGVISGNNVMFDHDLKTLESEGCISITDDIITFISW
jgi:hypothetical protein